MTHEVRSYFVAQFGDDISQLRKVRQLVEETEKEVETVKFKVRPLSAISGSSAKFSLFKLSERRSTLTAETNGIRRDCDIAVRQAENLTDDSVNETASIKKQLKETHPLADSVSVLVHQVEELGKCKKYLQWIEEVNRLSAAIEDCISSGTLRLALDHLEAMSHISITLQLSSCSHLKSWVKTVVSQWHETLKKQLSSEFDTVLQSLNWPVISNKPMPSPHADELKKKLDDLFAQLLRLGQREMIVSNASPERQHSVSLPIEIMVQPLQKRFKYHFYGKRPTNVLEKPEWYMRQVMNWLRDHNSFLVTVVQPVMDSLNCKTTAKMEFAMAMLELVGDKFTHDAPKLCEDENLLSHAVDEMLLFHQELSTAHGFPVGQLNCLHVLTEEICFRKWLEIERQNAELRLNKLLSSPTAWCLQYKDMPDVDEQQAPECAETFMTFLCLIESRFKYLPQFSCQKQFVDLQKEKLSAYSKELVKEGKSEGKNVVCQRYIILINAANFVLTVMRDWMEQPFYVRFHNQLCKEVGVKMEGVFSDTEVLYVDVKQEMLETLVDAVLDTFKAKSKMYKREKWQVMVARDDAVSLELTSSACDMLATLRQQLEVIQQELAVSLFQPLWMRVAENIDQYLYKEVVCSLHFNEAGAQQLHYDMTRNLYLLFAEYTSKPENFFRLSKEACQLLTVLPGSGILLREVLLGSVKEVPDLNSDRDAKTALLDLGVHKLTRQQALTVLMRRVDWPQS